MEYESVSSSAMVYLSYCGLAGNDHEFGFVRYQVFQDVNRNWIIRDWGLFFHVKIKFLIDFRLRGRKFQDGRFVLYFFLFYVLTEHFICFK